MDTSAADVGTASSYFSDFAAALRYWRGKRGLSQLRLSLDSGISQRHLSFLETGRADPSRELVLKLGWCSTSRCANGMPCCWRPASPRPTVNAP